MTSDTKYPHESPILIGILWTIFMLAIVWIHPFYQPPIPYIETTSWGWYYYDPNPFLTDPIYWGIFAAIYIIGILVLTIMAIIEPDIEYGTKVCPYCGGRME